jgi:hypothetical protein
MFNSMADGSEPATLVRPAGRAPLAPAGLGKKQGNLLTAVLRGIPLLGPQGTVPFAEADVRACLARFQPAEGPGAETGLVNRLRPRLLDAVVGARARTRGYIRGLPEGAVEPLLDTVGRAVAEPLVLRVVFGATVRVPLRALSYVLPAVRMAERIAEVTGSAPYLQAVYVGGLGARINDLPARTVDAEGALLAGCLERVLAATAPGVPYGFFADRPVPARQDPLAPVLASLDARRRGEIAELLAGKGGSRSARQTLQYAAAHALLHDRDAIPLDLVHGTRPPTRPVVLDLGGLQERHFHNVRGLFAAEGRRVPKPLVLTRHSVPPYTMSRAGDIALRDFLAGATPDSPDLPTAVRRDLDLLRANFPLETLR